MLRDNDLHWVPIIDAGIATGDNDAYNEGKDRDVFIKYDNGDYVHGRVWPGDTVFVDFFHPNAT